MPVDFLLPTVLVNFREFSDLTGRYAPPSRSTGYELYRKRGEQEEISCNHYDDTERSYWWIHQIVTVWSLWRWPIFCKIHWSVQIQGLLTQICPEQGLRRDRSQRTVSGNSPIKYRREVDDAFSLEASHRQSNATLPESFSFDGRGNWQTFSYKVYHLCRRPRDGLLRDKKE